MTKRTLGLLMPMPKAMVAQMTRTSSRRKSSWLLGALLRRQPGVIGPGGECRPRSSRLGHALGGLAALAIDDAALARARAEEIQHLRRSGLSFGDDAVGEVRPVEAGDEAAAARAVADA